MRRSRYSREVLAPVVATASSLAEVIRRLGLAPSGGNHRFIKGRLRVLGLEVPRADRLSLRARVAAIPEGELRAAVASSVALAPVLARFGLPTVGRAHRELRARLTALGVDLARLRGSGWARGETSASSPGVARSRRGNTRRDDEVFVARSPEQNGARLLRRLLARGWSYACAACGLVEWRGRTLVLHVDHINGVHDDNRLENLRLLCPNCHSLTDTYCNKRRTTEAR